jgi:peroxiredoxin
MGRGIHRTLQTGDRAPDQPLWTLDGEPARTGELWKDAPALLAFYKASCPTCQLALPFLERLRAAGAKVFCIAQDNAVTARRFNADFGMEPMPTLIDAAGDGYPASDAFGLSYVPSMFLVEPDGTVSWDSVGFVRIDLEQLSERLGIPIFHDGDIVPAAKGG